jgi:exodeoxyribonuclease VII small subunit
MIDEDIKKLDEIAKKMEGSDLPLEKSMDLFQEGIALVKKCTEVLQKAELRVKEIIETSSGKFEETPLK